MKGLTTQPVRGVLTLRERRKQVVRLHKQGIKIVRIVTMTGLSYPIVRSAIDLFEAGYSVWLRNRSSGA